MALYKFRIIVIIIIISCPGASTIVIHG